MGKFSEYLKHELRLPQAQQREEDTSREEGFSEAMGVAKELGRLVAGSVRSGHRRKIDLMDLKLRD